MKDRGVLTSREKEKRGEDCLPGKKRERGGRFAREEKRAPHLVFCGEDADQLRGTAPAMHILPGTAETREKREKGEEGPCPMAEKTLLYLCSIKKRKIEGGQLPFGVWH